MAYILRCTFEEPYFAPSFAMRVKMCIEGAFLHRNFLCKKQGTSSPGKQGIWYNYLFTNRSTSVRVIACNLEKNIRKLIFFRIQCLTSLEYKNMFSPIFPCPLDSLWAKIQDGRHFRGKLVVHTHFVEICMCDTCSIPFSGTGNSFPCTKL